jgi:hypothetical protein
MGGWIGSRAGLNAVEKGKKSLAPAGNRTLATHSAARCYTDCLFILYNPVMLKSLGKLLK